MEYSRKDHFKFECDEDLNIKEITTKEHMKIVENILKKQGVTLEDAVMAFLTALAMGDIMVNSFHDLFYENSMSDAERSEDNLKNNVITAGLYDRAGQRLNKLSGDFLLYKGKYSTAKFYSYYNEIKKRSDPISPPIRY